MCTHCIDQCHQRRKFGWKSGAQWRYHRTFGWFDANVQRQENHFQFVLWTVDAICVCPKWHQGRECCILSVNICGHLQQHISWTKQLYILLTVTVNVTVTVTASLLTNTTFLSLSSALSLSLFPMPMLSYVVGDRRHVWQLTWRSVWMVFCTSWNENIVWMCAWGASAASGQDVPPKQDSPVEVAPSLPTLCPALPLLSSCRRSWSIWMMYEEYAWVGCALIMHHKCCWQGVFNIIVVYHSIITIVVFPLFVSISINFASSAWLIFVFKYFSGVFIF